MNHHGATSGTAATVALCLALCVEVIAQSPPPLPPATPPSSIFALPPSGAASPATGPAAASTNDCGVCGIVDSIRQTTAKEQWTPLGMGVGVGGAPSNFGEPAAVTSFKIGPGFSNQGIVLLGSAGGASYRKAPNSYVHPRMGVTVKLDTGGVRLVTLAYEPYVREGDHVRVSGNNIELLE